MIKVVIEVTEERINALASINTLVTGKPTIIDNERLEACKDVEVSLESLTQCDDSNDYLEFNKFIMAVTASAINYFRLTK